MSTSTDEDFSQMTGGALRERLEESIRQGRQMQTELTAYRAKDVLAEKGFDLVKPEDLKDVTPEKIEARAQEIQAERETLQQELLTKALEKQGFKGDELDEMVQAAVAQRDASQSKAEAVGRVRSLGNGGTPIPDVDPEKLHGFDAMKFAIENPKRRPR